MANSGKQSPLGINVLGAYLTSTSLTINPITTALIGTSKENDSYDFGSIINDSCLLWLTRAINDGWTRGPGDSNATLTDATYNNLIAIGSTTLPALGNSKPSSYDQDDPAGVWESTGYAATTGYPSSGNTGQGQSASWLPYDTTNDNASVTQWGYLRLHALQGWNEFNWNGTSVTQTTPDYKEFCSSFLTAKSWVDYNNQAVHAASNSQNFMLGTYSNMNDMVSADIAGVSLSTKDFGTDLVNLGKIINLRKIDSFGLPSVLLATLGANSAVTSELTLALIGSGLSTTEIAQLISGSISFVTPEQEKKIYGAFLIITGENLTDILAPLQCNTSGLVTLADLLNVKMIFPTSYSTLTVPMYNSTMGLPTNSKTYYLIYNDTGINNALTTPEMNDYVGIQIPSGAPPIYDSSKSPENYVSLETGFGSYLKGIIPTDQAIAAGAFSFTMRQVRNIENVEFKKFAKAVTALENMQGLDLVGGTDIPTNQDLLDDATSKIALGSGPNGSYTMSDIFGCMSGLPYPWKLIQKRISELETQKLYNIYNQLYLAVTWEAASVTVNYTTYTVGPTTYYHVTGFTINDNGGYGRGTAGDPTITASDGTIGHGVVNRNVTGTAYGRMTYGLVDSAGVDGTSIPTATIQSPPVLNLPVSAAGDISTLGVNTASGTTGWPNPMNAVVQAYIEQANAEIAAIQLANPEAALHLQTYWTMLGSQLLREQRTRSMAIPPVSVPKDNFQNPYPMMIQVFVDNIPSYAQDTAPHMSAQTLEAISNLDTVGGQSLLAFMRQERNQIRLNDTGIELDNNIPDQLSPTEQRELTTNGTLPTAAAGAGINSCVPGIVYTLPAWPINQKDGIEVVPVPLGTYTTNPAELTGTFAPYEQVGEGDITPIIQCIPNPTVGPLVSTGTSSTKTSRISDIVIIQAPDELDPTNVRPNLDPRYTSSTLLPFNSSVREAINQVIECNCDCWIN